MDGIPAATVDVELLTSNCLLHMHRITWELLLGMVCTPGMAGTASRARAMTRPYHTAFARRLH